MTVQGIEVLGKQKPQNILATYLMKIQSACYIYLWKQMQILHFTQLQLR